MEFAEDIVGSRVSCLTGAYPRINTVPSNVAKIMDHSHYLFRDGGYTGNSLLHRLLLSPMLGLIQLTNRLLLLKCRLINKGEPIPCEVVARVLLRCKLVMVVVHKGAQDDQLPMPQGLVLYR